MDRRWLFVVVGLVACSDSVAGDDAGDSGGQTDATVDAVADAPLVMDAAKDTLGPPQCLYNMPHVDDAGVCHASAGTIDCSSLGPTFDRCVAAELHAADGGTFNALQCFEGDADVGQTVCCNGTNPAGVTLLMDPTWTCCPGAAPDGGMAACDPDAGRQCAAADGGGWVCQ